MKQLLYIKRTKRVFLNCLLFTVFFFVTLTLTHAATPEYIPLTGLPGVTDTATNKDLAGYINALFIISISLGGMLAVVKIAFAGFKYMLTDNIGGKGEARKDITGALLGLLILVSTFVVLSTIYPNLTSLQVLSNAETLDLKFASTTPQDFGCKAGENTDLNCFKLFCKKDRGTFNLSPRQGSKNAWCVYSNRITFTSGYTEENIREYCEKKGFTVSSRYECTKND